MFTGQVDMVRMVPSCETQTAPTNTKSHMSFRRTFSSERFIKPAINASVPILMANDPSESSMCGGLTIFTSSPYALCHQLSNGAEVSIAMQPHVAINAPSGPRNPPIFTDLLCIAVISAERRRQDHVPARDARQHSRQLDQNVRRCPERVAADRQVPRNVPLPPDQAASDSGEHAPDRPGDGVRAAVSLLAKPRL